jgi:predicted dehydrogenase
VLKGEMPIACTGVGGRQVRTDPKWGHIYDHFSVAFEYKNGTRLFSTCRQMASCTGDVNDYVMGTKGTAQLMKHTVTPTAGGAWELGDEAYKDMYQVEHDELFAGIRSGKLINDGESAAYSTLMALLAREAAYSGKRLTWKDMLASKQDLAPAKYDMAAPPPEFKTPMPGNYQFV